MPVKEEQDMLGVIQSHDMLQQYAYLLFLVYINTLSVRHTT